MANKKITVTRETSTGLNTHFQVPGRGEMTRGDLAREVDAGKHTGYHTRVIEGNRKIIASNPDGSTRNNLG